MDPLIRAVRYSERPLKGGAIVFCIGGFCYENSKVKNSINKAIVTKGIKISKTEKSDTIKADVKANHSKKIWNIIWLVFILRPSSFRLVNIFVFIFDQFKSKIWNIHYTSMLLLLFSWNLANVLWPISLNKIRCSKRIRLSSANFY